MTLEARSVSFAYARGAPALRDLSVSIEPGARTAVVGPNGAGKSTLLTILAGIRRPDRGAVTLDGDDVHALPARARAGRIAYIDQRPVVSAPFTARKVIELGRFALGASREAVESAAASMRLAGMLDEPFASLSVGQQHRVAVARALAQSHGRTGGCLIADEPTASMDPAFALRTLEVLDGVAERGLAVCCAMHDLTLAARWADHAVLLDRDGRVARSGPPNEALSPEALGAVFDVHFERLDGAGGPVLTPVRPGV